MSWLNSFDRPNGGIIEIWNGMHGGNETKISSGNPESVNIGLIMANASSQYGNAVRTPNWFNRTFGYLFHLLEGGSLGNDLNVGHLFDNDKDMPYPVDTIVFHWDREQTGIDSVQVFKYPDSTVYTYFTKDTIWLKYVQPF